MADYNLKPIPTDNSKDIITWSDDLVTSLIGALDLIDLLNLKNRGSVSSFDSAIETGLYRSEISNYLGTMLVIKRSNNDIVQVIFHWNSYAIYVRSKWNGTWSDVRSVSLT